MADTYTRWHFVFTQNNTISGRAVLHQIEDAINDLGQTVNNYSSEFSGDVAEALRLANQAVDTANTAVENAGQALTVANNAVTLVNTLQVQVDTWGADIQTALSQSATAVTQSTSALENAQSALEQATQARDEAQASAESASNAEASAQQAEQSAEDARQQAQEAVEQAKEAVEQAETAQKNAEDAYNQCIELAKSCYCLRFYTDGALSSNTEVPVADLTPDGNVKTGDLVVGTDGRIYSIVDVYTNNDGVEVALTGSEFFNLAPYVSYGGSQGLTAEQQRIARENIGLGSLLTAYEVVEDTDLNDVTYYSRLHVPENTENAPTTDAYFVDTDPNDDDENTEIRQVAVRVGSSEVYIRWGVETDTDDDEDEGVEWSDWQLISGGGGSDFSMTTLIAQTPNYYKRASLFSSDKTTITIPANTQVNIGNKGYISTADTTLSVGDYVSASDRAGKDLYLYACQPEDDSSSEPTFVISANSTVPDGYSSDNSRKIGGFHCECLAVGTIADHDLSGYATGDVLPTSLWDLRFRANSENEGMEFSPYKCVWVDIYLTSWNGTKLVSEFGGNVLTGYTTPAFHGDRFVEYAGFVKKRLMTYDEFIVVAKGSNELTHEGSGSITTAGGHTDSASRRMVSREGLEDCCGYCYQWLGDLSFAFNSTASSTTYQYGGVNTSASNFYTDGYAWATDNKCMNPDIDGDDAFGNHYGGLQRAVAGGWSSTTEANCGSRCVALRNLSAIRGSDNGCRCVSEPRVVSDLG